METGSFAAGSSPILSSVVSPRDRLNGRPRLYVAGFAEPGTQRGGTRSTQIDISTYRRGITCCDDFEQNHAVLDGLFAAVASKTRMFNCSPQILDAMSPCPILARNARNSSSGVGGSVWMPWSRRWVSVAIAGRSWFLREANPVSSALPRRVEEHNRTLRRGVRSL